MLIPTSLRAAASLSLVFFLGSSSTAWALNGPRCNGRRATIIGTSGPDVILGTPGDDVITALGGDDSVEGGGGNDIICGGTGDDSIVTGSGDDEINSGPGDDTIDAGSGQNSIRTGRGADSITAGDGDDRISAGPGADVIDAGDGANSIKGGRDDDSITAGDGDDKIGAGSGNDRVQAGGGNDRVDGGRGNDACFGAEDVRRCEDTDPGGPNASVVIDVEVDRTTGLVGTGFTFTASALQGELGAVDWTFSDGQVASGPTVVRSFSEAGPATATATSLLANGEKAEASVAVAIFAGGAQGLPGLAVAPLVGDVDNDGVITLKDAHRVIKHSAELEPLPSAESVLAADMDFDGKVTAGDARLIAAAVLAGEQLPRVLLPSSGPPGRVVTVMSPELLDPASLIQVEVGESSFVQSPFRAALGYATFIIPLDTPEGATAVRLLRDGAEVEVFDFDVTASPELPTDPVAALRGFLDDVSSVFEGYKSALDELLVALEVEEEDAELVGAVLEAAQQQSEAGKRDLLAVLDGPAGETLATVFLQYAAANGFLETQAELQELLETLGKNQRQLTAETLLDIVCKLQEFSDALSKAGTVVGAGCDGLLIGALGCALVPQCAPAAPALLAGWGAYCGPAEAFFTISDVVTEIVGEYDADVTLSADPPVAPAPDPSMIRGDFILVGLDDLCAGVGVGGSTFLNKKIAKAATKRLMRKKWQLRAMEKALRTLSEKFAKELEDAVGAIVGKVVDQLRIGEALQGTADKLCSVRGVPFPMDLRPLLRGPTPDVGVTEFGGDGREVSYFCPTDIGDPPVSSVQFSMEVALCTEVAEREVTVGCGLFPVTITMGDNGSANDDIFEVRVNGQRVLTSGVPVRSTSTTIDLPAGEHSVEMLGRAAPDGIGTYFISFTGAQVVSGDATSGRDLVPGARKQFTIAVASQP